jgi:hypothetical protein
MTEQQTSRQADGHVMLRNKDYREESCISKGNTVLFYTAIILEDLTYNKH